MANTSQNNQESHLSDKPFIDQIKEKADGLAKFGGFDLLESAIDDVQNLNPDRKARRKMFLTENGKKSERQALQKILELWSETLKSGDDILDQVQSADDKSKQSLELLNKNIKQALEESEELESSYRSVALFYKNTDLPSLKNVSIVNAELDQLTDLDNTRFFDHIREELVSKYDRLDLRENYSLMVLPGYLGSKSVVDKWAKLAHDNKVTLVTDFAHLDEPDDVMEMFESANLASGDMYLSNTIMTCNWLVGRGKHAEVGEEEDLHVAPSGALAGKIYRTLMSQVTAGKKHGGLSEVDGVAFDLRKGEIANLENLGLVPMVNEYGKVMAFSAKTLFNGDNLGLQTYSVVRVFDYVTKVLMDFLNRRAFENFNAKTRNEIHKQIVHFLDGITGPDKLIENFEIKKFEQDPNQLDRILLDVRLKPYFPAKNFLIKMDGQKGDEGSEWDTDYEQQ
ncbi:MULTISPECIES: DUF5458 family protein [Cellulophaga]|jgi:hypothetical protein|uniref:Uncharacterized protein n=2 Tax=Cellulophaga baltica TaxID=76594 RepID=A0A1G7HLJ0_9FLAO|nr:MULTISPECIES: DUF5458 family protein [Cellulophaga]WFO16761.1 DUF5458 family protein [Cellulophaga baltica 4]AIY14440.1 hypothetical protein M667_15290 [Cellulophaga baltica NN016038]AIZ42810.1 hypothetical protein M666_15245 [Cellulophaga baltica 18]KGK30630.1 hypothetical protein EL45_09490 [Cellulophaga sp. E6(2014)]MBA6316581.1 type VI secretion system contractile sheath protein TssC [Cellulophaga baltica]